MPLPTLAPVSERPDLAVEGKSKTAGQGLFAKQDLNPGDVIFIEERPLISTINREIRYDVCSWCFMTNGEGHVECGQEDSDLNVQKCSGCYVVAYCSKECQSSAWTHTHKYECKALAQATKKGQEQMPTVPFMLTQILCLLKARYTGKLDEDGKRRLRAISTLNTDVKGVMAEAVKLGKQDHMNAIVFASYNFAGAEQTHQTLESVTKLMAQISTNALSLVNPAFDVVGTAIYERISRINHSCDPNVIVTFDGPALRLQALKPVKKDEELFWSYISSDMPLHCRQAELQRIYCFTCRCDLCRQGEKGPREDWYPGVPPPGLVMLNPRGLNESMAAGQGPPEAQKFLGKDVDIDRVDDDTRFKTELCGMLDWHVKLSRRAPSATLEDIGDPEDQNFSATDLSIAICGLDFAARNKIIPPIRFPYSVLRTDFITACMSVPYFATAFRYSLAKYFLVDPVFLQPTWHPLRVIEKWRLAHLALNLSPLNMSAQIDNLTKSGSIRDKIEIASLQKIKSLNLDWGAVIYGLLIEIMDNVQLSHGRDSRFAQAVKRKFKEVETDMTRGDEDACKKAKAAIAKTWKGLRQLADGVDDKDLREAAGPTMPPPDALQRKELKMGSGYLRTGYVSRTEND